MRDQLSSSLVWASLAFVLALVVASLAALAFAMPTSKLGSPCETIDAETVTRETVGALRSEGWYAAPGDGAERLYSEGCLAPESGA